MNDRLFLLDGTLLFFRALYGTPDRFHDRDGRSVNGVRGYVGYLLKLLTSERIRHCAAAFDESLTTCWRNEVYPAYKANRPAADDDIMFQIDRCRAVTELLGIPVLADLTYEADDFIATLAKQSRRQIVIVSRDKDLRQLLGSGVSLLDPASGQLMEHDAFRAEFGFEPGLFPDFQALTGDSVDNIPGVRGVGPKSAGPLVARFGGLEDIYAHAADWGAAGIKPDGKVAERLRAERNDAFLFRSILRLDCQVPLPIGPGHMQVTRPARDALSAGVDDLGLLEALGSGARKSMETWSV